MKGSYIVVSGKGRLTFIETERVTHIEAADHSVIIHCQEEKYAARGPLKEVEQKLEGCGFVRVHRSFLVSIRHIREIDEGWIVLDDFKETEIPVGIKYENGIMEEIRKRNYLFL